MVVCEHRERNVFPGKQLRLTWHALKFVITKKAKMVKRNSDRKNRTSKISTFAAQKIKKEFMK